MKKKTFQKIFLRTMFVVGLLIVVLCIHIYIVTRPKAPAEHTLAMARIDIQQPISASEADAITNWLYRQKGVDHVLCNPKTDITVFTYYPAKANADDIVKKFKTDFGYKANRFIPSEKDLASGCPVAGTSITYKVYAFIKNIF